MTSQTRTVAVVGLGYGRFHVSEILRLSSRLQLVAVVDPIDPRTDNRLAGSEVREAILAVPRYETLDDLLASCAPDLVTIATPIHTHLSLACQALAAGADVLLEKPPTATLAEYQELNEAADRSGHAVQIGFQARGGHGVQAALDIIAAGDLGAIEQIGAVGLWSRNRAYYQRAAWAGRRVLDGRIVMDGVLANPLAHAVDIALVLAGAIRPAAVREVVVDAWHAHDIETDDTSALRVTTTLGWQVAAGLTLCAAHPVDAPVVEVRGTQGTLRLHYTEDRLDLLRDDAMTETTFGRTSLLENLLDHLETGAPLIGSLDSVGAFATVLEAIRTSPLPQAIAAPYIAHVGAGDTECVNVRDVEHWCTEVARTGRTFTELGAPWTRD